MLFTWKPSEHRGGFSLHRLALHSAGSGDTLVSAAPCPLTLDAAPGRVGPGLPQPPPAQHPHPADTPEAPASGTTQEPGCHAPCRRGLTAGGEVAAGVGGVHLRERVGAVLLALQPGLRPARLGLADDAAPALQADAVLAVELEVLPVLRGRGSRPRSARHSTVPRGPPSGWRETPSPPHLQVPGAGSGEDTHTRAGTCSRGPAGLARAGGTRCVCGAHAEQS